MEKQEKESRPLEKSGFEKLCDYIKENTMKSSIRDKTEGTFHELKGTVKEIAGKLSDNPKLQFEGVVEKFAGKVQEKVGQVKKVLGK